MPARSRTVAAALALCALPAPWLAGRFAWGDAGTPALRQMLGAQLFFAALAVLLALRLGGSLRDALGLGAPRAALAPLAFGALGTIALSGALQYFLDALALTPGTSLERLSRIAEQAGPAHPGWVLTAFVLGPALGEELLCRGALQRSFERLLGGWSVVAAAAAFAALHLDAVHGPAALVLGLYLGALARFGGSTWVAIACHAANNLVATLPQVAPTLGPALPRPANWLGCAAGLAVAGLALAASRAASRFHGSGTGGPSEARLRRRNGGEE